MKNSVPLIPLLLTASCLVALSSWIASLYGVGEVQSLLSDEGLRHEVSVALREYAATPELGVMLLLVPGLGLAWGSGMLGALWRWCGGGGRVRLTRRELRSVRWAVVVGAVSMVLIAVAVASPWAFLRGVTGRLVPSPFLSGLPFLVSGVLGLTGWIYGYTVGRFSCYVDFCRALTLPLRSWALYPVQLFFLVRLYGQLSYTRLLEPLSVSPSRLTLAFHVLALALAFGEVWRARRPEKNPPE